MFSSLRDKLRGAFRRAGNYLSSQWQQLHGCRQNKYDIRADSGFDAIAERERFIVVYPFVTGYWSLRNKNCWAWWVGQHTQDGSGEVGDIGRIVKQVQNEFSVDPQRLHITGLSSGAGMTIAAMVTYGSLFASGARIKGGQGIKGGQYP